MAVFPKAGDAKERAQGNKLIAQVINRIEEKELEVIEDGPTTAFEAEVSDDTVMNNSTPTTSTSRTYYNVFKGSSTNAVYTEQMNEVIAHFENLDYTISRIKHTHVDPTQTGDGSTVAFTLSFTPASTASVTATVAGNSTALSLSGAVATFTTAPGAGEAIIFSVADNVFKWKVVWA